MFNRSLFKNAADGKEQYRSILYTKKNYFQPQNTTSKAKEIARSTLNNFFEQFGAFDFVNEIVNSSFESAQKPTAHSGSRVNKSMFENRTEKFPWLIVNNIKEQTTPSSQICQEQRNTLKF